MGGGIDLDRRRFLKGRFAPAAERIRPPWSTEAAIRAACTGCGACVTACPEGIVRLDPDRLAALDFAAGACTFCGKCADACTEPVFDRTAPAVFPHIAVIGDACFAKRGIVCQSCSDVCPEAAIRSPPRLGGPAQPVLAPSLCTGCGACIAACPADAIGTRPRALETGHG
jgi:ferredoxin-type protein NapF